jgi:hypothetical protein
MVKEDIGGNPMIDLTPTDFDVTRLILIMCATEHWTDGDTRLPRKIQVERAKGVDPYRDYQGFCQSIREGRKIPPITVVQVKIGKEAIYLVEDGHMRLHAHLKEGQKYIWAYVNGSYVIPSVDPYRIWKRMLWKLEPDGTTYKAISHSLSRAEEDWYRRLGVEDMEGQ